MLHEDLTDTGSLYTLACPSCGAAVRPRDHFCANCGRTLTAQTADPAADGSLPVQEAAQAGAAAADAAPPSADAPGRSSAPIQQTAPAPQAPSVSPVPIAATPTPPTARIPQDAPAQQYAPAAAAPAPSKKKRRKKLWIIPVCFFLVGALLGFLAASEETGYETEAVAVESAAATGADDPSSIVSAASDGSGTVSDANPLVRLPETPDAEVRNPCPAGDLEYLESALPAADAADGSIPMAMLSTERLPYLFSAAFRPGRAIDGLMAVIVVEFSEGKTVATSAVPVYYRKAVAAGEFCACTFDVSTLDYRFQLGMGGAIPVSNDGANVIRMINEGKTSLQLFSGSQPVGTLVLSDHTAG